MPQQAGRVPPGGILHWVGADHLGGTIRVLNDSFTALDGMCYKPYGEDRDTGSSLNTDRKFTGQTEDEAAGLTRPLGACVLKCRLIPADCYINHCS